MDDDTSVISTEACPLLGLSNELIHIVFTAVDPPDLARLSRTCRNFRNYIHENKLLHKEIYLRRYDEPLTSHNEPDWPWEQELYHKIKLEKVLASQDEHVKREHLGFVSREVQSMLETANTDHDESANVELLKDYFSDTSNINTLFCSSSLFDRGGTRDQQAAATSEDRQASAKLHCLYGKCIEPVPSKRCSSHYSLSPFFAISRVSDDSSPSENTRNQTRGIPAHTVARSRVYDLRQYTDASIWGPFRDDGTQYVDWEKVEAVMLVLGFNLNKFYERTGGRFPQLWNTPFEGATPNSYVSCEPHEAPLKTMDAEISMIRELEPSIDSLDPYGVTGTWMRIVCFLDYNDLYAFNFSSEIPHDQEREPIDTEEAIRLIRIKLQVTRIDPPGTADEEEEEEDVMDWSNFKGERLPIVHFTGTSRSLHASWDPNANSRIRGSVRQTPEGEIRWTTFSIFHGEERWRSEGIQVGGIRSGRGVLGNWFDKDYDMHGPAGPTAFWKESDELVEEKTSSTNLHYF